MARNADVNISWLDELVEEPNEHINQTRCRVIERLTSGVVFKIKQKRSLLNIIFLSSSGLPEEKKTETIRMAWKCSFQMYFHYS